MAALAWRQITTLQPWASCTSTHAPHGLMIRFETDVVGRREGEETQAVDLLKALLRRADEYSATWKIRLSAPRRAPLAPTRRTSTRTRRMDHIRG
ncbi:hypothetical protein ACFXG6_31830 [Streptomyces roseus]|uniref:hypothetical protein n=1 Tax=Streptomyces roseus TaxID=66430 RepID=UPI00367F5C13